MNGNEELNTIRQMHLNCDQKVLKPNYTLIH